MSFTRKIEDFVCSHCGTAVRGNGYTNHCPNCLWSRHVDIHPGDREATCGGEMQPIRVEREGESWIITHRCRLCHFTRRQRSGAEDNFDVLVELSAK